MCGLVGVVSGGTLSVSEQKVFAELLQADIVRGDDSFGVFQVETASRLCSYHKIAGPTPKRYMETSEDFKKFLGASCVARLGHNRAATRGEVTSDNAHPFREGHITLAHNGTLRENIGTYAVDSQWLANKISTSDNVLQTLGDVNGAFALIWYDQVAKRVFVARNNERPLHVAKSKHGTTWFFASEGKMLEWILERNKVSHDGVAEVPHGILFGYPVEYNKPVTQETIPQKKWQSSYSTGYGYGDWDENYPASHTNWRNRSTGTQQSSTQTFAQSNTRWEEQKLLVEITDWWPVASSSVRDSKGNLSQAFAAVATVVGIAPPINKHMAGTIGSQIVILNLSEEKLDYIVEKNFSSCVAYSRMAGKPITYHIIPHTRQVGEPANWFHYNIPNAQYAKECGWESDKATDVCGYFASGSASRPSNVQDWEDAIYDADEIARLVGGREEVTPKKEVPQQQTLSLPAAKQEETKSDDASGGVSAGSSLPQKVIRQASSLRLNVLCAECGHEIGKTETLHVNGVMCVCSLCLANHINAQKKVKA